MVRNTSSCLRKSTPPLPLGLMLSQMEKISASRFESGSGFTWSVNSRENRLTSWTNDPVSDPTTEALYIRDEETGEYWTPTPLPIREDETYLISHGQGYSHFEHI